MGNKLTMRIGQALTSFLTLPLFLLVLLVARLLLLALLFWVTGGKELGNDVAMHMTMMRSPFCILTYQYPGYEQYPPFLPFLELFPAYLLQFFLPDFLSFRLTMVVYEILVGFLFYRLMMRLEFSPGRFGLCLLGFLALPMGWMTSIVMAQDVVIVTAFLLLAILLFISGRHRLALFSCGLGVICGKLFIILEIFTLLAFCSRKRIIAYGAIGLSPVILVYGLMSIHRIMHGLPLPLVSFRPDPYFGTNFWILLKTYRHLSFQDYGPFSGMLALSASLIPALIIFIKGFGPTDSMRVITASSATILIFFSLFYHVNPEYFMMVFPLMLIVGRNTIDAVYSVLISAVPWAGKFFQNAQFQMGVEVNEGKAVAMKYYMAVFHSSPEYWLAGTQIVFSILTITLSIRLCLQLFEPKQSQPQTLIQSA
ncbi:hypothetical protein [Beijerinckia indica]|uniref:Integral membrane protein-like protein n=1 Tax=Beijerinckia indica subsp. indica (strain ATCC 9039 / DSM 1715 / NCIMB 8712) TaxID=395963 RepID=B2ICJ9_BEII9|nr:hypothetical protein [Beijerinckia indica]ACB93888.1 hypothetical protein Bind_0232 [Beijerinckia indica subsp. indica ATCC 9039]